MKTIVEHPLYGRITYDSATERVTVQKGDLAERLTWLLNHYYPNAFLRACDLLGIRGGELDVSITTDGEATLPDDAVY